MKKFLLLILIVAILITFVGCSQSISIEEPIEEENIVTMQETSKQEINKPEVLEEEKKVEKVETEETKNVEVIQEQKVEEVEIVIEPEIKPVEETQKQEVYEGTYKVQVYTVLKDTSPNRVENIRLATSSINDIIIKSGEEFSFNNVVGKRTAERGYKEALIIYSSNGKSYTKLGLGGGICQVSSTLYMACKELNLEILERRPHSSRVTYCSIEDEAMISWGTSDFRFRNSSTEDITIKFYILPVSEENSQPKLVCEIW